MELFLELSGESVFARLILELQYSSSRSCILSIKWSLDAILKIMVWFHSDLGHFLQRTS